MLVPEQNKRGGQLLFASGVIPSLSVLNMSMKLPDEMWGKVLAYLMTFDDVFHLQTVSKLFRALILFGTLYRRLENRCSLASESMQLGRSTRQI